MKRLHSQRRARSRILPSSPPTYTAPNPRKSKPSACCRRPAYEAALGVRVSAENKDREVAVVTTSEVRTLTLNQAINEAIRLEMRRDPNVIIIGEDVAGGAGRAAQGILDGWTPAMNSRGLIAEFGPERVIDTPI